MDLTNLSGNYLALIVLDDEEGEFVTNQTGGCCCNHPEARGHVYFLESEIDPSIVERFHKALRDVQWYDNDEIKMLFARSGLHKSLKETRFSVSEEAWLYATVLSDPGLPFFKRFAGQDVILSWCNSD